MSSNKNPIHVVLAAICLLSLASCSESTARNGDLSNNRGENLSGVREPGDGELDLGEDWGESSNLRTSSSVIPGAVSGPEPPAGRSSYWTIVLGTYPEPGHAAAAENMIRQMMSIDGALGRAHVHTTSKGSMVVYGSYEAVDSKGARRDLAWIKGIRLADRPVFPRAILSRINVRHARGQFKPNELLSIRLQYPRLSPLYTLQIAVWGDFGSGKLAMGEIQSRAEAFARELRSQGYQAFFHHDEDLRLSMVTVGLFDKSAVDSQSGIMSPEVEIMMREFPVHLVNGEELQEMVDRRNPKLGTRVQQPKLVLVPEL